MNTPELHPGARAVAAFEIEDVFCVESQTSVARDFNPSEPIQQIEVTQSGAVEPAVLKQTRTPLDGSPSFTLLRYFVITEVALYPGEAPSSVEESAKREPLARIRFVHATDYRCPSSVVDDTDAIGAFSRNAVFHAWPFVREAVHAACSRLRVPPVTLPMLKPNATFDAQNATTKAAPGEG